MGPALTRLDVFQGRAFFGERQNTAPAGSYSYVQLWNPLASGVNLVVHRIEPSVDVWLHHDTAARANLQSGPNNMLLGGAGGQGEIRYESNASHIGTWLYFINVGTRGNAQDPTWLVPIILRPGNGLNVKSNSTGVTLKTSLAWLEVPGS